MVDLLVVGLGGMGAAVAARAAQRGYRVTGIDRFARGHALGSSSGSTRIIRKAYFEDAAYVPLLLGAYERWRDLETRTGTRLLDLTGVLVAGDPASAAMRGVRASARDYDIAIEELDRSDLLRRYPGLRVLPDECGLLEHDAGSVFPEAGIAAHLALAESFGANLRFETHALARDASPGAITIRCADGSAISASRVAICAGPWLGDIAGDLGLPLRVQRNVQLWFDPATDAFRHGAFPAFFLERTGWPTPLYGFPDRGAGVKAALHGFGVSTHPDDLDRAIHEDDVSAVTACLDAWMPGAAGPLRAGKACMYTMTPDGHFVIDRDPRDERIIMAGGFSGHGYKFAAIVGEIVTDLAFDGTTPYAIDFLRATRLRGG